MARKWESNEPQRERETEIRVVTLEEQQPERLTDDDLAFHAHIHAERRAADQEAMVAAAGMEAWARYVDQKYGLGAGDLVDERGVIRRHAVTPEGVRDASSAPTASAIPD